MNFIQPLSPPSPWAIHANQINVPHLVPRKPLGGKQKLGINEALQYGWEKCNILPKDLEKNNLSLYSVYKNDHFP